MKKEEIVKVDVWKGKEDSADSSTWKDVVERKLDRIWKKEGKAKVDVRKRKEDSEDGSIWKNAVVGMTTRILCRSQY